MPRNAARTLVVLVVVTAVLAGGIYTAYAGNSVYQSLDSGKQELLAAQASMKAAGHTGDAKQLRTADAELKQAEHDFTDGSVRARHDVALRLAGGLPGAGRQVDATARLAAIGADLCRAGEAAAAVAIQLAVLKQQYVGRPLTADDLQALLKQAQTIATTYQGSIQTISQQLKAAHAERAQVTTTGLLPQLHRAYDEVDHALTNADTAFLRYQDVHRVLSDFLGTQLPG